MLRFARWIKNFAILDRQHPLRPSSRPGAQRRAGGGPTAGTTAGPRAALRAALRCGGREGVPQLSRRGPGGVDWRAGVGGGGAAAGRGARGAGQAAGNTTFPSRFKRKRFVWAHSSQFRDCDFVHSESSKLTNQPTNQPLPCCHFLCKAANNRVFQACS